jgi:hypothetical protein
MQRGRDCTFQSPRFAVYEGVLVLAAEVVGPSFPSRLLHCEPLDYDDLAGRETTCSSDSANLYLGHGLDVQHSSYKDS